MQAFKGGYDIDFYQEAAKEWADKKEGIEVKAEGDPRVWEKLRLRFTSGNPPDLTFPGWGMDHWALAEEGQLEDLTEALKSKPWEGEGTWAETFNPTILAMAQYDGKQYTLPYYVMIYGWWYDPDLFAKNGWTPPKTYDELLVVGEKMKAAGAKRALPLQVGGAFHSPLMEPAREELASAIESATFNKPICHVYQNVTAKPATDVDVIRKNLIDQLTAPVRWTQSVQQMVQDGATTFIECGPGKVLQGLVKKIAPGVETTSL